MGAPDLESLPQQAQIPIQTFHKAVSNLPKHQRREIVKYVEHNTGTKAFVHDSIDMFIDYPAQFGGLLFFAGTGALWIFRARIRQLLGIPDKRNQSNQTGSGK